MGMFRTLRADEIDCRIAQVGESYIRLLLYKDARVDQNILDETVGQFRWKRTHQLIGDRLYCTVAIKSEDGEWIEKQDVGTESKTEAEKGQASDSFKRACFNWGIGRELYTAPDITLWAKDGNYTAKNGKCYDRFSVKRLEVKDGVITKIEIVNAKTHKVAFSMGYKGQPVQEQTPAEADASEKERLESPATDEQLAALEILCERRNLDVTQVFNNWPHLTQAMYEVAYQKLGGNNARTA